MIPRIRSAAVMSLAVAIIVLCAVGDPGVPAAAVAGLGLLGFLLVEDASGGLRRHLLPLAAAGICAVLTAAALLLPPAPTVLTVVAGLSALAGAFRLSHR